MINSKKSFTLRSCTRWNNRLETTGRAMPCLEPLAERPFLNSKQLINIFFLYFLAEQLTTRLIRIKCQRQLHESKLRKLNENVNVMRFE